MAAACTTWGHDHADQLHPLGNTGQRQTAAASYNFPGTLTLTNSTLLGERRASDFGGAPLPTAGTLSLSDSPWALNTAGVSGGALDAFGPRGR